MVRRVAAAAALSILAGVGWQAGACSRASDEGEAKQWQTPPPGRDPQPPGSLHIEIKIDGTAKPPITAALLQTTRPDFTDDDRSAWLIQTLVPEARSNGATVEAVSPQGVSVKFARPTPEGLEPVLFLTRRGEVIVSALDPKEPFPRYHGQGGRLHRAGDSLPRVAPVARLEITRGPTR
jgi:hypothetical protein